MSFILDRINQGIDYVQTCNCTTVAVAAVALVGLVVVSKWAYCLLAGVLSALTTSSKLKKYYKPGSWAGTWV